MKETFIKKYWVEENVLFYLHFRNDEAIRQVEITPNGKIFLSLENPIYGESILYDQSLNDLDLQKSDYITETEFNKVWNNLD